MTGRPNEELRVADAELAINPNYAAEYAYCSVAESHLQQLEQARSDLQQAMRLSPRDPRIGFWHDLMAEAELGLGRRAAQGGAAGGVKAGIVRRPSLNGYGRILDFKFPSPSAPPSKQ